jgi:hypothetical protein
MTGSETRILGLIGALLAAAFMAIVAIQAFGVALDDASTLAAGVEAMEAGPW